MHIDMDAFFASVEQYRNHPELIGRAVCVGHDPKGGNGRGVVRAASYEARAKGIHAGMPVSQAYRLCPEAAFVDGSFESYLLASDEFIDILREYADNRCVRRASIDEAYIEVTEGVTEYESPIKYAQEIQEHIRIRTSLPCSIGIAPNMSVAKIATGMNKPRGITLVGPKYEDILEFLRPLPVDALNGVGKKTASYLEKFGITTLGHIQSLTLQDLWPIMGRGSQWLYNRACGIDDRVILDNGPRIRKSISKDRTFMADIEPDNVEYLHDTIRKICNRIGQRLIDKNLRFRTVTVKIRYDNYFTIQRSKSIPVETDDIKILERMAIEVFNHKRDLHKSVRLIGIKISGLSEVTTQLCLTEFL